MKVKTISLHTIDSTTATTAQDNHVSHPELDTVLLKVAARCNINCTYCYVFNMGDDNWLHMEKLMSRETIDAVCQALGQLSKNQQKPFSVVLHGGEPLLLGAPKLEYLLRQLRNALPDDYPISIQTNGILITDNILDVCSTYRTTVAVSIDGPRDIHDKERITHNGSGTFDKVLEGIQRIKAHPDTDFLDSGCLAVIDPSSNPEEVYSFFKGLGTPSVDFLYKDGNHSKLPHGKATLHSIEYGSWMVKLLNIYLQDSHPLPIRILDDMLKVILGGVVSQEGAGITDFGILIIDTDGTLMKNDTLKSSYNGADKFAQSVNIKEERLLEFLKSAEFYEYHKSQKSTSEKCINCADYSICGGGMKLHRWKEENGFNNPSVYCEDQLHLIKNMRKAVAKLYQDAGVGLY